MYAVSSGTLSLKVLVMCVWLCVCQQLTVGSFLALCYICWIVSCKSGLIRVFFVDHRVDHWWMWYHNFRRQHTSHLHLYSSDKLCSISGMCVVSSESKSITLCIALHECYWYCATYMQDVCRRIEGCETSPDADFALGILSIVGVTLSLFGLVVTIFTMLFFKWVNSEYWYVCICICILCSLHKVNL